MTKRTPHQAPPRTRANTRKTRPGTKQPSAPTRPGGKLGLILDRLEAKPGATIGDLVEATGWQKHSVHGALSRLRTQGFAIRHEVTDGRKAYSLSKAEG
jgi:hypothetical protein